MLEITIINGDKKSLIKEKESLERTSKIEIGKLKQQITSLDNQIKTLKTEGAKYILREGMLTIENNKREDHKIYIEGLKTIDVFLFDTTADADVWIKDVNNNWIAKSSRNDVISNFTTPYSGEYTFVVWKNPTKYKLNIYVRN